jgi:hypothetical protein
MQSKYGKDYVVEELSKHEKEVQQRREEGEKRERGGITQPSTGMKTQLTLLHSRAEHGCSLPPS